MIACLFEMPDGSLCTLPPDHVEPHGGVAANPLGLKSRDELIDMIVNLENQVAHVDEEHINQVTCLPHGLNDHDCGQAVVYRCFTCRRTDREPCKTWKATHPEVETW